MSESESHNFWDNKCLIKVVVALIGSGQQFGPIFENDSYMNVVSEFYIYPMLILA